MDAKRLSRTKRTWVRLGTVSTLAFRSTSSGNTISGWVGSGEGTVEVSRPDSHTIIYAEKGTWCSEDGISVDFRNTYRWRLNAGKGEIALSHLRFGPENVVELVHLYPLSDTVWQSVRPHSCGQDRYEATLFVEEEDILLCWSVKGPQKEELLQYVYM